MREHYLREVARVLDELNMGWDSDSVDETIKLLEGEISRLGGDLHEC